MSGMEIDMPLNNLPYYEISYIQENSPADLAGLKIGDQILAINGKNIVEYSLNDVILLLSSYEGKKISIKIMRDGVEKKVKFRLVKKL